MRYVIQFVFRICKKNYELSLPFVVVSLGKEVVGDDVLVVVVTDGCVEEPIEVSLVVNLVGVSVICVDEILGSVVVLVECPIVEDTLGNVVELTVCEVVFPLDPVVDFTDPVFVVAPELKYTYKSLFHVLSNVKGD